MLSSTVHIVVSPSLEGGAALRPPRHRPSYSFLNFGARRAPVVRLTGPAGLGLAFSPAHRGRSTSPSAHPRAPRAATLDTSGGPGPLRGSAGFRCLRKGVPMSHYKSNVRDLEFNLFEMLSLEKVLAGGAFGDLDGATVREMLAEAARLAA